MNPYYNPFLRVSILIICSIGLSNCAVAPQAAITKDKVKVPEVQPGVLAGYLNKESLPNSLSILPAPPLDNSELQLRDVQLNANAIATKNARQWQRAISDAKLDYSSILKAFSCELGVKLGTAETSNLTMLLRRSMADAGLSTYAAKQRYLRERPFKSTKQEICTPDENLALIKSGSYPSGHAAIGMTWAFIFSNLIPSRRDTLIQRGKEFGDNRVTCGVHWQSDVDMGRVMGQATYAALLKNPEFKSQLENARHEINKQLSTESVNVDQCTIPKK